MYFGTFEILIGVISLLLLAYYYYSIKTFNFWKSKGIPGPKPIFIFGTIKDIVLEKFSVGNYMKHVYDQYPNEPMVGIFTRNEPVLILNDMELIKTVLIKDFKSFVDRSVIINERIEPLAAHLFQLEAKRWRPLRTKLSPVFTSGKLKDMFYFLVECADKLDKYLGNYDGKCVDMREISARFTTDVIGLCVFGLQANALEDENSLFRKMGKKIFDRNWKDTLRFRIREFIPILYHMIGGWFANHDLNEFFINLTRDTIEYRKKNDIKKHDFIELLAALKDENNEMDEIDLTDTLLAAQLFVFFVAGFETSSTTISNCLFELALNHEVQNKLRKEIKEELKTTNMKITYDLIKNMQYLDQVFNETLRKYPPVPVLMRRSTAPYTFANTKVSLPIDTPVWIPIYAIQHDAKYFPNPDKFDPERFTKEETEKRPTMSYLPFGDGPRNCIGLRFAQMQSKVGLVKILQNHIVDVCEETDKDYTMNNRNFLLTPKNGIVLKIKKE